MGGEEKATVVKKFVKLRNELVWNYTSSAYQLALTNPIVLTIFWVITRNAVTKRTIM